MKQEDITIVYAISNDYDYVMISMVSIASILCTKSFYTVINIYILVDEDFEPKLKKVIQDCLKDVKDCTLIFKSAGHVFDRAYLGIPHIKRATYFRLLIPDLIPDRKCIYLDSDTIVCEDLRILYDTDLTDYYIAGVKAPVYYTSQNSQEYCQQARVKDLKQYVNAGVLLMNLEKMRRDHVVEKLMKLLPIPMISQDQDMLNSACYGNIWHIPFRYNVMIKYSDWNISDYQGMFSSQEIKEAWNNPGIIHYADRIKPWNNLGCVMGDYWWNVCRVTPFWDYFYKRMEDDFFYRALYRNSTMGGLSLQKKARLFDLFYFHKVVIYGAGVRGKQVINFFLNRGGKIEYILVSKCSENPKSVLGIKVKELTALSYDNRAFTVVVATKEEYHKDIIAGLLSYHFREIIPLNDNWKEN